MKLTNFFILLTSLQLSATTFSQNARITVRIANGKLADLFKEIENQSEYKLFYKVDQIDLQSKLSYAGENMLISEILNNVLPENGATFDVVDKVIVITPAAAQAHTISGVITDANGLPLTGVNIVVKGTTRGVISDVNGKYAIEVPDADAILQFSFIGYLSIEKVVGNQASIDVTLLEDVQKLDEVVVVGYGTMKKSDVTGAMIRVSENELKSRPVANALEAMQGKATGVDITSNERPGDIGKINIRGVRSLTASNTPLYVVDGIPLMASSGSSSAPGGISTSGLETINPADIESIDILKDASATAIYGSRGANGVILVTTKKGKSGKMSFNYSGTVTIETLQDRQKMMNADEYLTWRRWSYYYLDPGKYPRGDQPTVANDSIIFLAARDVDTWNNIKQGWANGSWDGSQVATTDWTGMVTRTGVSTEHNLSASGGTEKIKAYGSFGYLNTQGTMKGQGYTRYSSKVSIDLIPMKWFEMGVGINTSYGIQQYGTSTAGGGVNSQSSIYTAARGNLPYAVPFKANGDRITYPGGDDVIKTVVDEWKYSTDERKTLRVLGSAYAQLNILPGLKYRLNFGPDFRNYKNGVYIDAMSVTRVGAPNLASLRNENNFNWTLDNLIYYDKTINKHTIGATFLHTASAYTYNYSSMRAIGIPIESQKWNALNKNFITALDDWNSDLVEGTMRSWMGRLNYGFDGKYMVTVSGRWDGASQLAAGHKWSFFPSAALAWKMDQENWLKNISLISQLKVRLGVGTTGNSAINAYQTKAGVVSLFYPYGSSATQGNVPSESLITNGNLPFANPNLGWEKTTQYNFGIDFALLKGRVSGVVDLYTSRTKDLLMQMNIPPLNGSLTTYANVGETRNRGIDITLTTVNTQTRDFSWSTGFNVAWQKDEIVSLSNGKSDDISNLWFIGQSLGVIYGYESQGLWHEEDAEDMAKFNANGQKFQVGMARPVDLNGDYKIDPNNDRKIIGHTRPRWTVGFTNTLTYKNIDLSFLLYGRLGYTFNTGGEWQGGRYPQRRIDYYTENNVYADYQKPIYNVGVGDPYYGILGYRSGSFLKIRDISLGYTLPISIAKKLGLQTMKIYAQAKNPGMLFSKISWLDMDQSYSGNGTTLDPTVSVSTWNRGFVFGVNVGF